MKVQADNHGAELVSPMSIRAQCPSKPIVRSAEGTKEQGLPQRWLAGSCEVAWFNFVLAHSQILIQVISRAIGLLNEYPASS